MVAACGTGHSEAATHSCTVYPHPNVMLLRRTLTGGPDGATFAVTTLDLGRAVHVWVGSVGAPPTFGALTAAVPSPAAQGGWGASGGEPAAATNLLGDSSTIEPLAARLSAATGKAVLLSTACGGDDSGADGDAAYITLAWLEKRLLAVLREGAAQQTATQGQR